MRFSNIVRRLENGVINATSFVSVKAEDLRCAVSDKFNSTKLEVKAVQLADLRYKMRHMPPLDRQEVELRASEINMIRDATLVRRQELKRRRELARKVLRGELVFTPIEVSPTREEQNNG